MSKSNIIQQAMALLVEHATTHDSALTELCWLDSDEGYIEGHFCRQCAQKRADASDSLEVDSSCGGFESPVFETCEDCGAELQVSILPTQQELEHTIHELKSSPPSLTAIYHAYELLYNSTPDSCEQLAKVSELTEQLAEYVVNELKNDFVLLGRK